MGINKKERDGDAAPAIFILDERPPLLTRRFGITEAARSGESSPPPRQCVALASGPPPAQPPRASPPGTRRLHSSLALARVGLSPPRPLLRTAAGLRGRKSSFRSERRKVKSKGPVGAGCREGRSSGSQGAALLTWRGQRVETAVSRLYFGLCPPTRVLKVPPNPHPGMIALVTRASAAGRWGTRVCSPSSGPWHAAPEAGWLQPRGPARVPASAGGWCGET